MSAQLRRRGSRWFLQKAGPRQPRARLQAERLENRYLLAAFDLSSYELHLQDPTLEAAAGENTFNYSGIAFRPDPAPATTGSFFIIENAFNGVDPDGRIHEYRYGFDGGGIWKMQRQARDIVLSDFDLPGGINEGDPEAIIWKGPTGGGRSRI